MTSHADNPPINRSHEEKDPQERIIIHQGQRDGSVRRRVCTIADLAAEARKRAADPMNRWAPSMRRARDRERGSEAIRRRATIPKALTDPFPTLTR